MLFGVGVTSQIELLFCKNCSLGYFWFKIIEFLPKREFVVFLKSKKHRFNVKNIKENFHHNLEKM